MLAFSKCFSFVKSHCQLNHLCLKRPLTVFSLLGSFSLQLDYVVQFIVTQAGQFPDCSIFSNCALLMVLAFFPIFPLTLFRNITPFQITSTIRYVSEEGKWVYVKRITAACITRWGGKKKRSIQWWSIAGIWLNKMDDFLILCFYFCYILLGLFGIQCWTLEWKLYKFLCLWCCRRNAILLYFFLFFFCSISCIVFVAVVMSVEVGDFYNRDNSTSIRNVSVNLLSNKGNGEDIGLFPESIMAALTCISYCSLCFVCHFQVFSLENELERPTKCRLNFIIIASMLIAYTIYNVVALSGYLQVSCREARWCLCITSSVVFQRLSAACWGCVCMLWFKARLLKFHIFPYTLVWACSSVAWIHSPTLDALMHENFAAFCFCLVVHQIEIKYGPKIFRVVKF